MKKIIIAIALMFGSVGLVCAQTTTDATNKKQKKEKTTTTTATKTTQTTGLKKNGTPDMRLKANKVKAQTNTTQPVTKVQTQTTVQPKPAPVQQVQPKAQVTTTQVTKAPAVKTADAVIGTDAKGRTLYQGPKGGKYYINKNGNKEYVK